MGWANKMRGFRLSKQPNSQEAPLANATFGVSASTPDADHGALSYYIPGKTWWYTLKSVARVYAVLGGFESQWMTMPM